MNISLVIPARNNLKYLKWCYDAIRNNLSHKNHEVCVADELASTGELVMGKSNGVPVAVIRGGDPSWFRDSSMDEIVRPPSEDLFR